MNTDGYKLMRDGKEVKIGDKVKDFRGNPVIVSGFALPKHEGSTGRVYLKAPNGVYLGEFYPSVVDCAIVKVSQ